MRCCLIFAVGNYIVTDRVVFDTVTAKATRRLNGCHVFVGIKRTRSRAACVPVADDTSRFMEEVGDSWFDALR